MLNKVNVTLGVEVDTKIDIMDIVIDDRLSDETREEIAYWFTKYKAKENMKITVDK